MAIPIIVRKPMPLQGLNTALPTDLLSPGFAAACKNVRFRFGEVRARPGSGTLSAAQIAEPVTGLFEFVRASNDLAGIALSAETKWITMLQDTKMYRFGDSVPGSPASWFEVAGPVGQPFNSVTRWSITSGEGYMFFASDDSVYRWDGNNLNAYEAVPITTGTAIWAGGGPPKARFVAYFNNRLVLAFTHESAGLYPQRLRWSESGDHRRWDDTTGTGAGFIDLFEDGEEQITAIVPLGNRLMVYKEHSITEVIPTGDVTAPHRTVVRSRGIGCAAPYTVASNGFVHFFVSHDFNVYSWDGTRITPIGDMILPTLRAIADPSLILTYFGAAIHHRNEYWLVLQRSGLPTDVFVYDWSSGVWARDSFPDITALLQVQETTAATQWSTITNTWQDVTGTWAGSAGNEISTIYGGKSTGATIKIDESFVNDENTTIDNEVVTRDFYFDDEKGPWVLGTIQQLLLAYTHTGGSVEVRVSLDRGVTWSDVQSIIEDSSGYGKVNFNGTGNVVRFFFRNRTLTGHPRWRHFAYEFINAGPFRP